jgi:hypothetical protein
MAGMALILSGTPACQPALPARDGHSPQITAKIIYG